MLIIVIVAGLLILPLAAVVVTILDIIKDPRPQENGSMSLNSKGGDDLARPSMSALWGPYPGV